MSGVTLDAGALIALERGDRRMVTTVRTANSRKTRLSIPVGALAQAWRDGRTQVALARLLKSPLVDLVPIDASTARAAGELCGRAGTRDVIDATVVLCARRRRESVITSDVADLRRLDPSLTLVEL